MVQHFAAKTSMNAAVSQSKVEWVNKIETIAESIENISGPINLAPREKQDAQHDTSHQNIVVAWTPRAGCTFVMEFWFRFLGIYEKAVAYHPFLHKFRVEVLQGDPIGGKATNKDLVSKGNFKFKVVMNPYHRAVTMYEHAMQSHKKCLPASKGNFSFMEFLQTLQDDAEEHGGKLSRKGCYKAHYAPQVALQTNDASLYDLVCRLEDGMNHCFSEILSKTGLSFFLPESGGEDKSHHNHEHRHVEGDVPNMPYTVFGPKVPLSTDFYVGNSGMQAAILVKTLYRHDFEAYGYDTSMISV